MIEFSLLLGILCCIGIIIIYMIYSEKIRLHPKKEINLEDVMPIQFIDENFIVNGNGDITFGYNLFLPEVFLLSTTDVEIIHQQLEGLIKILPAGTTIHQQIIPSTQEYDSGIFSTNYLINENRKHFSRRDILRCSVYLYITFSNEKKIANNNSLLRKPNFLFKQPFKKFLEKKKELEGIILNFENALSSISYFECKKLNSSELNNYVFDYLNQSYHSPTNDATQEVVSPISVDADGIMKVGNRFVKIVSLIEEGTRVHTLKVPLASRNLSSKIEIPQSIKSQSSMIYPITLGLPFNHITNVIIEKRDNDTVISEIKAEKRALNVLANFYEPAKAKQKEQDLFCKTVNEASYDITYTAVNVIIADENKDSLNKKIALTEQGFNRMGHASCYVENEETANLFFASIPGNGNTNYRGFINTSVQAICYLQKDNLYLSSADGFRFVDRFGTPAQIDLWYADGLVNRNRIIIGPSGSGKSFNLNDYVLQSIEFGRDIITIDIGRSFKSLVLLNGGKYFDSKDNASFCFNPFLCDKDRFGHYSYEDKDDEGLSDHIQTLSAIISFIWKKDLPILPTEKVLLEKSFKEFYSYLNARNDKIKNEKIENQIPILPNLKEYFKFTKVVSVIMPEDEKKRIDFREIRILLEPYVSGELQHLLNAEENINIIHDKLLAFDVEDVSNKDYFPVIAIILLQLIVGKIKKREGIEKTLIIDEALDFLSDEKFGSFIAYLYRTFRKKEGEIILAAQNVLFIKSIPPLIRDSIIINCSTKIILDHSEHTTNLKDIKDILSISDDELDMISSLQKTPKWREFFIKIGNDAHVFRTEVSEPAIVAFESHQKTVVAIKNLFKEYGSIYLAINKYLENKRNEINN